MTAARSTARSLRNSGANNPNARLTAEDAVAIRARCMAGENYRMIASDFKVDPTHVSLIARGKRWAQ